MNLDEYQEAAKRTLPTFKTERELGDMTLLGLIGETGEVSEIVKKARFHGKAVDKNKLIEECGDVLWYTATEFTVSGFPMSACGQKDFASIDSFAAAKELCDTDCVYSMYMTVMEADGEASLTRLGLLSRLLQNYGSTLEEAATANVAKLLARYPDGK